MPGLPGVTIEVLDYLGWNQFRYCPLCLGGLAVSLDHVPPESVGGRRTVLTCELCNNRFGTAFENHLADWFESRIRKVRFSQPHLQGRRAFGTYRETPDDPRAKFELVAESPDLEALEQWDPSGPLTVHLVMPSRIRAALALLKAAYLAACAHLGFVPDTYFARSIRQQLVRARDAPRNWEVDLGTAQGVFVGRVSYDAPPDMFLVSCEHNGQLFWGLCLETLVLRWPFPDCPPTSESARTARRIMSSS